MGNCINQNQTKENELGKGKILRTKKYEFQFNINHYQNCMKSYQIDLIDQKIEQVCINQKKKLLNFQYFLQLVPYLKNQEDQFGSSILRQFFYLFDLSDDGYIQSRQVIAGLALIYHLQPKRFGLMLIQIFSLANSSKKITKRKLEYFQQKNTSFKIQPKGRIARSKTLVMETSEQLTIQQFCQQIVQNYNIEKYRLLFDLFSTDIELQLIISLAQNPDIKDVQKEEINMEKQDLNSKYVKQEYIQTHAHIKSHRNINIIKFEEQRQLQDLITQVNKISIKFRQNQPCCLISMAWFKIWHIYIKRFGVTQIQFQLQGNVTIKKYQIPQDQIKDKERFIRPGKIQNFKLFGEYQGELKSKLVEGQEVKLAIFEDFVPFEIQKWKSLVQIYGGGPMIERRFGYYYPLFINRVFINKDGKFIPNKLEKYALSQNIKLKEIFKDEKQLQNKVVYMTMSKQDDKYIIQEEQQIMHQSEQAYKYYSNTGNNIYKIQQRWEQIQIQQIMQQQQIVLKNHQFIILIQKSQKPLFQKHYLYFNNNISYGDYLNIKLSDVSNQNKYNIVEGRIIQIGKDSVKIHYTGKSYGCDYIYPLIQITKILEQNIKQIQQKNMQVPKFKNIISNFKSLNSKQNVNNLSYMTSVLHCLVQTPYFDQFLLQKKYKRIQNKQYNFKNTLIRQLSTIVYDSRENKNYLDFKKLHNMIISKIPQYQQDKQFQPDKFLFDLFNLLVTEMKQVYQGKNSFIKKIKKALKIKKIQIKKQKQKQKPTETQKELQLTQKVTQTKSQTTSNNISDKAESVDDQFKKLDQKLILNRFFSFQQNQTFNCGDCRKLIHKKKSNCILQLNINQDQIVLFQGIFHPLSNSKQLHKPVKITKFGVTKKLSSKFIDLAKSFLYEIQKLYQNVNELKNLYFSLAKSGQFRKHFQGQDFNSTLNFLNLKKQRRIMIYQLKQQIPEQGYQDKYEAKILSHYTNNMEKYVSGCYVDYKGYNDWQIAKFLGYEGKYAKIINFQHKNTLKVDLHKILPFKQKTNLKQPYKIQIIHRKLRDLQTEIICTVTPLIISIHEYTKMSVVEQMIDQYMRRYKKYNNKIQDAQKNLKQYQRKITLRRRQTGKLKDTQQNQQSQKQIIFNAEIQKKDYQIKYLRKTTGDACYFCGRKSKIHHFNLVPSNTESKNQQALSNRYCYGNNCLNIDNNIKQTPIGCFIDLKKLYIVVDWKFDIKQSEPVQNHSFVEANKKLATQYSTIQQCFKLLEGKTDKQFVCDECNYHQAITRKYISVAPNILIISLRRFVKINNTNQKLQNKIQFKEELDLVNITNPVNSQDTYELYAIICFKGNNLKDGKWYSYVLQNRRYWIRCDQHITYCQDVKDVKNNQIFMLFYRKKNIEGFIVNLVT